MGGALIRGVVAFFAMYLTFIVTSVVATILYAGATECADRSCSIGEWAGVTLGFVIVYAYTFALLSPVAFIPYMILFLVLTYLNGMNAVLWAVIGAGVAVWLGLSQLAFGEGVGQGGGWPVLVSTVGSVAGLIAVAIGAACGLAVWTTDRRLKAM